MRTVIKNKTKTTMKTILKTITKAATAVALTLNIHTSITNSLPFGEGQGGAAYAATITVTNNSDNGAGSLRKAIADAANGDIINFSVTGAIFLTSEQLTINKNISIIGPGAASLTISGDGATRVFFYFRRNC